MKLTRAIVRSVSGAEAIVEIESTGCGRCDEPGGCGGGKKADLFCRSRTYRVLNPVGAHAGELVNVAIADGVIAQSATRAYVVPLLCLLFGAVLGRLLGDSTLGEAATIGGAVLGLAAGWRWLHVGGHGRRPVPRPTIVARA